MKALLGKWCFKPIRISESWEENKDLEKERIAYFFSDKYDLLRNLCGMGGRVGGKLKSQLPWEQVFSKDDKCDLYWVVRESDYQMYVFVFFFFFESRGSWIRTPLLEFFSSDVFTEEVLAKK